MYLFITTERRLSNNALLFASPLPFISALKLSVFSMVIFFLFLAILLLIGSD